MRRSSRLPLEALLPYTLDISRTDSAILDWKLVFGNDRPVEIEVGCGKGLFLLTAALERPDVNFLGIEIVRKYQLFTATRIAKRGLRHVRVACADAGILLRDRVATASVQAVHVYFPDPWWKQRHHKRRVFTSAFVDSVVRIVRPGGYLFAATDVPDYYRRMYDLVAVRPEWEAVESTEPASPAPDLHYPTNFERKARVKGMPVYRLTRKRLNNPRMAPEH